MPSLGDFPHNIRCRDAGNIFVLFALSRLGLNHLFGYFANCKYLCKGVMTL